MIAIYLTHAGETKRIIQNPASAGFAPDSAEMSQSPKWRTRRDFSPTGGTKITDHKHIP